VTQTTELFTLTLSDFQETRARIAEHIKHTPLLTSRQLSELTGFDVRLKAELFQRVGSYKIRGPLNKFALMSEEDKRRGVVCSSAGNHAQGVALAAKIHGIRAVVCMATNATPSKVAATKAYGAEVVLHGNIWDEANEKAKELVRTEGLTYVHPFDDEQLIAGQGTLGLEIVQDWPDVDAVVVPIGGGGLISGIALAIREQRPDVRVYGVEAAAAASAAASRRAGHVVKIESTETIADGIAVKRVGDRTFPLIERYVDDIVAVSEEQIASAVHLLLEQQKTLAEGAGATPLAAIVNGLLPLREDDVVVMVLSGGNIDVNLVSRIVDRGLVADGRLARLAVTVHDRPGNLARLTAVVAEEGANVLDVAHSRAFADISVRDVQILMHLETRGREHMNAVVARLTREGFVVREDV
jgi:threonine dehydratase